MPTISQIVEYLTSDPELGCLAPAANRRQGEIDGVRPYREAGETDLAWLSAKEALYHNPNLVQFQGGLLIATSKARPELLAQANVIACANPKLAFIKVLDRFFAYKATTTWPAAGGGQIAAGSKVAGDVSLAPGAVVGSGVEIHQGVVIGPNSVLANCLVHAGAVIGANCSIGLPGFGFEKDERHRWWRLPHLGRVVIGPMVEIGSGVCIDRGGLGDTIIERGVKIDNMVHVAHNVVIGEDTLIAAKSTLGGSCSIGPRVWIAPSVTLMNKRKVGHDAYLGLGAVVFRDVKPEHTVVGNPAKIIKIGNKLVK